MTIDRRRFIQRSAGLSATGAIASVFSNQPSATGAESVSNSAAPEKVKQEESEPDGEIRFIATWPFGKFACEKSLEIAKSGSMLDAIEQGIWVTESDAKNASVGIGGIPNATGQVELDACFMSGPDHNAGSVAGIRDILHPISVARAIMERTPHVMLAGQGALDFALENGFSKTNLLTEKQKQNWEEWKTEQDEKAKAPAAKTESTESKQPQINEDLHDTIALLGIDAEGNLYGGCSTSGWGYKIPGRVGDSPIIGSGLYVDNKIGAAGATGLGENVMRHCGSFLVVEMMRWGASPTAACELAIKRIAESDPKNLDNLDINFIAINKAGEVGAAGTSKGFKYSVTDEKESKVLKAKSLSEKPIDPEGGNTK